MPGSFAEAFSEAAKLLSQVQADTQTLQSFDDLSDLLARTFMSGNKVLVCGNGGSLADAMHFAEEWTGRFRENRKPYPVLALADPTHMSCTANDFGFDAVFQRGIQAFGKPGDLCFLLSTSGNSQNLINAALSCRDQSVKTVGFLGKGGGALADLCDWKWIAPGKTSDRVQELHMMALHILIEVTEHKLNV